MRKLSIQPVAAANSYSPVVGQLKGRCVMNQSETKSGRPHTCVTCGAHYCCDERHCSFTALTACASCSHISVPHSLMSEANRVAAMGQHRDFVGSYHSTITP